MRLEIYVEGGGGHADTLVRCRRGFSEYCKKVVPGGLRFAIVPCGGRGDAFRDFRRGVGNAKADTICALLVDSEGEVREGSTPVAHLQLREGWEFAGMPHGQVFLMVQAMEAWLLADRAALARFFGAGFRVQDLRGDERNVEAISKDDLVSCLRNATRDVRTKGAYHKTRRAFDLLAEIDPEKVAVGSIHAAQFHRFLRSL